jgi:uncharacterized membrane protein YgdD (TMEM256/DUF423 family)
MNSKNTILSGVFFGFLGVALGAFGAHALKPMLTTTGRLETYELAVRYEFYHALALLLTGILLKSYPIRFLRLSALFFAFGILLFSGSLFLLCFTQQTMFGAITPIGGTMLLLGWALLGVGVYNSMK